MTSSRISWYSLVIVGVLVAKKTKTKKSNSLRDVIKRRRGDLNGKRETFLFVQIPESEYGLFFKILTLMKACYVDVARC